MSRSCTICRHPDRNEIERALIAGEPFRYVAVRFETSAAALFRHKGNHPPATLVKASEAEEAVREDSLLTEVKHLQSRALNILGRAEESGDLRAATGAIREARGVLELLAKMVGELDERNAVNVAVMQGTPEQFRAASDDLVEQLRAMAKRSFGSHERMSTVSGLACTSCLCLNEKALAGASVASQTAQLGGL